MAITPDDVAYTARLARLALTDEEIARLGRDLGRISAYVAQLTEAVAAGEAARPVLPLIADAEALRDDVVQPSLPVEQALSGAPDVKGPFFRVPKVIG
ncbi:MAG: Asp-tRNA(Asn)/Glu-tRNA(Gln) amidotransferase subunit GatC [candidate division Zixibacteria bacterium]|nr:Asp-tRNA(Asn)/Glu-tRNA(Gln) amidotransferase subunit GatC [candidate division Zixibacteria bacterium]